MWKRSQTTAAPCLYQLYIWLFTKWESTHTFNLYSLRRCPVRESFRSIHTNSNIEHCQATKEATNYGAWKTPGLRHTWNNLRSRKDKWWKVQLPVTATSSLEKGRTLRSDGKYILPAVTSELDALLWVGLFCNNFKHWINIIDSMVHIILLPHICILISLHDLKTSLKYVCNYVYNLFSIWTRGLSPDWWKQIPNPWPSLTYTNWN